MSNESNEKTFNRPAFYQRKYVVDKPFQYRLIGTLLAIWLANSVFFALVLYFFYEGHLNQFYDLVPREDLLPLLTLPALFGVAIGFVVVFGLVILGIVGLYMSNQIAGPLYRTKLCMDRVGKGDWGFNLQFRHGDFLRDLPGVFNQMLESLRETTKAELEELRALQATGLDGDAESLVRNMIRRKESQLGQSRPDEDAPAEQPPVSVAVH